MVNVWECFRCPNRLDCEIGVGPDSEKCATTRGTVPENISQPNPDSAHFCPACVAYRYCSGSTEPGSAKCISHKRVNSCVPMYDSASEPTKAELQKKFNCPPIQDFVPTQPEKHPLEGDTYTRAQRAAIGRKDDSGKPRWGLLPFRALREVVKVYTEGARKYGDHNWKNVEKGDERYLDAILRHIDEREEGLINEKDFGLLHSAHIAWNALALVWFDLKKIGK